MFTGFVLIGNYFDFILQEHETQQKTCNFQEILFDTI